MTVLTVAMLATLVGAAVYLILSERMADVLIGVALLSNGVNLLLIESSQSSEQGPDPLPQALILTAIVIGFALVSILAAFVIYRMRAQGHDHVGHNEEDERC